MVAAKEWGEVAGIVLLCVVLGLFGLALVIAVIAAWVAAVGTVVGALFGGIGAGAYVAFKWIVALAGWWL